MFDKKQVQEAIKRVDNTIAQLNGNRQTHVALANDVALVQEVCMDYFDERSAKKDILENPNKLNEVFNNGRTDKSA